ncbi:nucleotide pyrophosphohydrolase [Aerococcus sanguinicola]|uniref:Nucleotide pyrophosphohydrolase n=1 Tax=Aerococcus sanguinicola TaxID=119206 RepID=A0A0X8FAD8_9LACT|nr:MULTISPECIES: nucleotide pyrophosphohydrolase [Aerococcus]AMB93538.1 nucleotide pyrophosphohydrolase [Aerococcus sanguinicola]MDK7050756.1 nucleotide pyrophosphohydrolase [Aerococcus sanguinicola]OFT97519.1 nucleotide pyrophosphohydrolase [Aerococcus sp. HMSC23C02]PKZ21733.1 nucleotide pyrophosphohydrolase [Aerococcus sanguinicola]
MTLMDDINAFRDERDWRQFHNEKDLALSLVLEASELLEIYQWKSAEEGNQNIEAIKDELADVLIYAFMLADNLDLDIEELIPRKLAKNAIKYPVDKSRGQNKKYTEI